MTDHEAFIFAGLVLYGLGTWTLWCDIDSIVSNVIFVVCMVLSVCFVSGGLIYGVFFYETQPLFFATTCIDNVLYFVDTLTPKLSPDGATMRCE